MYLNNVLIHYLLYLSLGLKLCIKNLSGISIMSYIIIQFIMLKYTDVICWVSFSFKFIHKKFIFIIYYNMYSSVVA